MSPLYPLHPPGHLPYRYALCADLVVRPAANAAVAAAGAQAIELRGGFARVAAAESETLRYKTLMKSLVGTAVTLAPACMWLWLTVTLLRGLDPPTHPHRTGAVHSAQGLPSRPAPAPRRRPVGNWHARPRDRAVARADRSGGSAGRNGQARARGALSRRGDTPRLERQGGVLDEDGEEAGRAGHADGGARPRTCTLDHILALAPSPIFSP
jgi:hypothetical protein